MLKNRGNNKTQKKLYFLFEKSFQIFPKKTCKFGSVALAKGHLPNRKKEKEQNHWCRKTKNIDRKIFFLSPTFLGILILVPIFCFSTYVHIIWTRNKLQEKGGWKKSWTCYHFCPFFRVFISFIYVFFFLFFIDF